MNPRVMTGLENLYRNPNTDILGLRLGLLANPASIASDFTHAAKIINKTYPGQLKALFSPQHGFNAEKQDNMIESDHYIDPQFQIPVFSLYSSTRIPTKEMFDHIDVLIIDLQDVGTRVYTFIYTISYCLEAAELYGKKVIILDRPNPVGGTAIEGNILKMSYSSFVGRFPIPMRHGLTVGEIATFFNCIPHDVKADHSNCSGDVDDKNSCFEYLCKKITDGRARQGCDLTVIPMKGWKRKMLFSHTALPWIPPSPNLPTPVSALVYPGQVIWEGTNISEGRGTTQPFEIFGAPFLDTVKLLNAVQSRISGAVLRPVAFEPTSGKWQGERCHGFQIHVVSPDEYNPYITALLMLQQIIEFYPDQFQWKQPPYEYEYEKLPMDLILGDKILRQRIERGDDVHTLEASWQEELQKFQQLSREFYLYV